MPKLYDAVRMKQDRPEEGVTTSDVGTILFVFSDPREAYELEFSDADGVPFAQFAATPDEFTVVERYGNPG